MRRRLAHQAVPVAQNLQLSWNPYLGVRIGEALNPGPPALPASKNTLRFLSWNIGSWDKRANELLRMADTYKLDVIMLQEHGVRCSREAALTAQLRRQGWQTFWGPTRPWGAGEMVMVHRRYAAMQLKHDELPTVLLCLKNGSHIRISNVYAPSGNSHDRVNARQEYFQRLSTWTSEPGSLWVAGGDFNHNLSECDNMPFNAHWLVPEQGMFRRTVHASWLNPIDGFVSSPALQHGAQVQPLPEDATAQHCPVLCDFLIAASQCERLTWIRPTFQDMPPWPLDVESQFHHLLEQGHMDAAWELWVQFALGASTPPGPLLKLQTSHCLSASNYEFAKFAKLQKAQRTLLRKEHLDRWSQEDLQTWDRLDQQISALVLEGRNKALSAWKDGMHSLSAAASWAKIRPPQIWNLKRDDGLPAISPKERGQAVAREWSPVWTSPNDSAERVNRASIFALDSFLLTHAWSPCPERQVWTSSRIKACLPQAKSAPGPDGITSVDLAHLREDHLDKLAVLFNKLDAGAVVPSQWKHARMVTIPKESGGSRPITVLCVAYRAWAKGLAQELGTWCKSWSDNGVVGGIKGSIPASVTAAMFSAEMSKAHLRKQPACAAFLDTSKCFDSVILDSLDTILRRFEFPSAFLEITRMWRTLERHVWVDGEPSGTKISPACMRGIPQGDPMAPLALNLIMHCWLKTLPVRPLQNKIYLDDRGLLDPDPAVLEKVIIATRLFDFAFGFNINLQKSVRMAVHCPKRFFSQLRQLAIFTQRNLDPLSRLFG